MDHNHIAISVKKVISLQKTNKSVKSAQRIKLIPFREEFAQNVQNLLCQMKTGQNV
jgi:hypothetical protein